MIRKPVCDKCGTPREPDTERCKPCRKASLAARSKRLKENPKPLEELDLERLICCPQCGTERKFYLPSGKRTSCKVCAKAYRDKPENNAKSRATSKAWRESNPERHKQNSKKWSEENADRKKTKMREWYHIGGGKEWAKEYKLENRDKINEGKKVWQRTNQPSVRKTQRKILLKKQYGLTEDEYDEMFVAQNGLCAIHGGPETVISKTTGNPYALAVDHNHETGQVRGLLCKACNLGLGYFMENPDALRSAADYLEFHASKATVAA